MPLDALALVLAAAALHAGWNVLLAGAPDRQATTAAMLLAAVVLFAPAAAIGWDVERSAAPYAAGSAALELAYFALLAAAYRRLELGVVYPLARGLAPLLVLAVSVGALGIASSAGEALGVGLVCLGVWLVAGSSARIDAAGLVLVGAVAAAVAGYTLVDRDGVTHAGAVTYLWLVLLPVALVYALAVGRRRTHAALDLRTAAAGAAMFGAYVLVLLALRLAAPAPVAAVREVGIVLAVGLGAFLLGEPAGARRVAGAISVAAGVAAITLA